MTYESVRLTACEPGTTLTVYAPDNSLEIDETRARPAVVLCVEGEYAFRSFRETEPVVLQFLCWK